MHRYAVGFVAGAAFLALTEGAVLSRAIHRALTGEDEPDEDPTLAPITL